MGWLAPIGIGIAALVLWWLPLIRSVGGGATSPRAVNRAIKDLDRGEDAYVVFNRLIDGGRI